MGGRPTIRFLFKSEKNIMNIKKLGVIGAGQIGSGVAQIATAGGLHVILSVLNR
jgi:phosphoglycerate dehydrogenase-like enzyme